MTCQSYIYVWGRKLRYPPDATKHPLCGYNAVACTTSELTRNAHTHTHTVAADDQLIQKLAIEFFFLFFFFLKPSYPPIIHVTKTRFVPITVRKINVDPSRSRHQESVPGRAPASTCLRGRPLINEGRMTSRPPRNVFLAN